MALVGVNETCPEAQDVVVALLGDDHRRTPQGKFCNFISISSIHCTMEVRECKWLRCRCCQMITVSIVACSD